MANEIITGNKTFRVDEKFDIAIVPSSREKGATNRRKNFRNQQSVSNENNLMPIKRSTTQKCRDEQEKAQCSGKNKISRRHRSKNPDERADKSRGSSYQMMSDNHYDHMSMNLGGTFG